MKYSIRVMMIAVGVSLSLGVLACGDAATNNATSSNAVYVNNTESNSNTQNSSNPNSTATPPISTVQAYLHNTLYEWAPEEKYEPSTALREIWARSGNHPWNYYPKAATALKTGIQKHEFFKDCQRAQNLKLHQFNSSGDIQTVKELYEKLYDCPN